MVLYLFEFALEVVDRNGFLVFKYPLSGYRCYMDDVRHPWVVVVGVGHGGVP